VLLSSPIHAAASLATCDRYTDPNTVANCQLLYGRLFHSLAYAGDAYKPAEAAKAAGHLADAAMNKAAPGNPTQVQQSSTHSTVSGMQDWQELQLL
jgi:hypothetical protein